VTFQVQDIVKKDPRNGEDVEPTTFPCVYAKNADFDEDQGQEKGKFLPLTTDLVLKYVDKDEGKCGYTFFYPSQDSTWLFEFDNTEAQVKDMNTFKSTIC
jgi:predicted nucleic-acid-binding Zn-ribbon protein